jgi:sodium transport system permease protein
MMAAAFTVCRKEMLENARDRRTLFTSFLFGPLFGPIFFGVLVNLMVSQSITSSEEPIFVTVVGPELAPNLTAFLSSKGISLEDDHSLDGFDAAVASVRAGDHDVVLLLDDRFSAQLSEEAGARLALVYDRSNSRVNPKLGRLRSVLAMYSQQIASLRLFARGIDPGVVRPFIIDEFDISTASGRSVFLLGTLTYFLLLATLMGGLYLAIDTTAGERERKSLEPLFTTPVTRTALLLGKMCATMCFMLLSLALTLAGFVVAVEFLPLEELGMSSAFGPLSALKAFAILAPFVPLGAAVMTLVASFTRSYKEAQGYLTFVLLVPTLPVVFASIMNVRPSLELMAVPSLSQHLLISTLIRGETPPLDMFLVACTSTLACGVLISFIATRFYKREGILG